jgi:hypothetical protein
MININNETLLTLAEAARSLPGRVHVSSLWRWARRGIKGVKLESIAIGGRRFTSIESLQRFADQLSEIDSKHQSSLTDAGVRERRLEAVEQELRDLGL